MHKCPHRTKDVQTGPMSGNENEGRFSIMRTLILSLIPVAALAWTGCDRHVHHDHGHTHAHGEGGHAAHAHSHTAPHGGTAVVLGEEAFHLEFVRDAEAGTLGAYLLDGHMENFVRVTNSVITLQVAGAGPLPLAAQTNSATGETVGDTSFFLGRAEWLVATSNFQAVIPSIGIRGSSFTNVSFSFPEGNE